MELPDSQRFRVSSRYDLESWTFRGVKALALAPDHNALWTCNGDGTLQRWSVPSLRPSPLLGGPEPFHTSVAFSPDGRRVVAGTDGSLTLWDAQAGVLVGRSERLDRVQSALFLRDGSQILAAEEGGKLSLWDAPSLRPVRHLGTLGLRFSRGTGMAASPDGEIALLCDRQEGVVVLVSLASGEVLRLFEGYLAALSPDGRRVHVLHGGGRLVTYQVRSGRVIRRYQVRAEGNVMAAVLGGTHLLLGSKGLALLGLRDGAIERPGISMFAEALSVQGSLVVLCERDRLVLWDMVHGSRVAAVNPGAPPMLLGAETDTRRPHAVLRLARGSIQIVKDDTTSPLDLGDTARRAPSLAFALASPLLACGLGWSLELWDHETGSCLARRNGNVAGGMCFSIDATRLACAHGHGSSFCVLSVPSLDLLFTIESPTHRVWFADDDSLFSLSHADPSRRSVLLRRWSGQDGQPQPLPGALPTGVMPQQRVVAISATRLAVVDDEGSWRVRVFDLVSGALLGVLPIGRPITQGVFIRGSRHLVLGGSRSDGEGPLLIEVWDIDAGHRIERLAVPWLTDPYELRALGAEGSFWLRSWRAGLLQFDPVREAIP